MMRSTLLRALVLVALRADSGAFPKYAIISFENLWFLQSEGVYVWELGRHWLSLSLLLCNRSWAPAQSRQQCRQRKNRERKGMCAFARDVFSCPKHNNEFEKSLDVRNFVFLAKSTEEVCRTLLFQCSRRWSLALSVRWMHSQEHVFQYEECFAPQPSDFLKSLRVN